MPSEHPGLLRVLRARRPARGHRTPGRVRDCGRLFDIRRIIGGLFIVYGAIVALTGITASDAEIDKAEGVDINLWTGLGMLGLGVYLLA